MNKEIELLNNKIDAQDKIIKYQALEIARLKEWKEDLLNENIELENIRKEAIEYLDKKLKLLPHYMYEVEMYDLLNILNKGGNNVKDKR